MLISDDPEQQALARMRDEHVEQIRRTGTTEGITIKGFPTVLLAYRGAITGETRKTPVMRVEHEGRYAAVASKGGEPTNPLWYASVVAEPHVELQDGTVIREYQAREVFGDEKAEWWGRAVDAYPDYAAYQRKTDRQIPLLVLEPVTGKMPRSGRRYGRRHERLECLRDRRVSSQWWHGRPVRRCAARDPAHHRCSVR